MSSVVATAFSGAESTRYPQPDGTGTRGSPREAASSRITIGRVVPVAPDNPPADRPIPERLAVRRAHRELDRSSRFEPEGNGEAAVAPGVQDPVDLDVWVERMIIRQKRPLEPGCLDQCRGRIGVLCMLREIFEDAAVLGRQGETREHERLAQTDHCR